MANSLLNLKGRPDTISENQVNNQNHLTLSEEGGQAIHDFKVCMLGDMGVGKTCIVNRYCHSFFGFEAATIGANYASKETTAQPLEGSEPVKIKMKIWDTAGNERYRALMNLYYKDAEAIVLVYDITNLATFATLKDWVIEI